ncbi:MAG: hypothetical protein KZQ84_14165 [Candidatus Thiodiazotropha sp. (ex Lucinoma borealis)]|nr:hypothetical protein [Candidatus Thiodiazotropha sp. (ex Lucinoma borealis)]
MKTTSTVVGVLLTSFIIADSGVAQTLQNTLKAGGVDDEEVANAYYETIDPDSQRLSQSDWEDINGYNDPINTVVVAKGHFSAGDLGFWREISMVRDKRDGFRGNIAFTTVNYNTEQDSLDGTNPVSIVNMEYSPGPEEDRITKFYIYDVVTGERVTSTTFDTTGEELFLPAGCFSCHGGDDDAEAPLEGGYNEGSGETNATFLAFDANTMTFGNTTLASLESAFKELNKAVLRTDPTKATRKLVKGLYGGSRLPRNTQNLDYIPASWADEADLYREVIIPSCRGCHTTSDTKLLSLAWWKSNPGKIREVVFHEHTMPNSLPNFERFWMSVQPWILDDALIRFGSP